MKVAIVNDTPMAVEALRRTLASNPRYQVSWVAENGKEAVLKCAEAKPDLILMDLVMPVMDGVTATRRIMAETPCPILILTSSVGENSPMVFDALGAGAVDVIKVPPLSVTEGVDRAFMTRFDMLARLVWSTTHDGESETVFISKSTQAARRANLVAIGCSAGGPAALVSLLRNLPADFPAAVIIVQHLDEQFAPGLAEWLGQQSKLPVRLAIAGDHPTTGVVLLASPPEHLVFTSPNRLGYTSHPNGLAYRPSVDVFFESLLKHWRGHAVGVLLTGMGRDGAQGLRAMRDTGYHTIAQDRATSAVYGMPKVAAELNAAVEVLPLEKIGATLIAHFKPH
jgi:two-component system response regulator WspF